MMGGCALLYKSGVACGLTCCREARGAVVRQRSPSCHFILFASNEGRTKSDKGFVAMIVIPCLTGGFARAGSCRFAAAGLCNV